MAENDIDYFIEKVNLTASKSELRVAPSESTASTKRSVCEEISSAPAPGLTGRFAQVRHEDNLTKLQRGQYKGPVTSQMCKDLASRIDATGLNVDLSKLPVACSGKHSEAVSEHIKMKRRNTIQRDAMHASIKDEHLEHHVHA